MEVVVGSYDQVLIGLDIKTCEDQDKVGSGVNRLKDSAVLMCVFLYSGIQIWAAIRQQKSRWLHQSFVRRWTLSLLREFRWDNQVLLLFNAQPEMVFFLVSWHVKRFHGLWPGEETIVSRFLQRQKSPGKIGFSKTWNYKLFLN